VGTITHVFAVCRLGTQPHCLGPDHGDEAGGVDLVGFQP
jgi:hypothetical protein